MRTGLRGAVVASRHGEARRRVHIQLMRRRARVGVHDWTSLRRSGTAHRRRGAGMCIPRAGQYDSGGMGVGGTAWEEAARKGRGTHSHRERGLETCVCNGGINTHNDMLYTRRWHMRQRHRPAPRRRALAFESLCAVGRERARRCALRGATSPPSGPQSPRGCGHVAWARLTAAAVAARERV